MFKAIKIRLHPNNKQNTRMFQYAGAARYAYNWALRQIQNGVYDEYEIRRQFTRHKKLPGKEWLNDISNDVMKQAIRDACDAQTRYRKGLAQKPRFKSRDRSQPGFYQDSFKIRFTDDHVRIQKLLTTRRGKRDMVNWIKLAEKDRIPTDVKYYNPRFTFDGLYWNISVAIEVPDPEPVNKPVSEGIGIDLGIKYLAFVSDGHSYENLNKTPYLKKIKKRERRTRRRISRKYVANNPGLAKANNNHKKGKRYRRSRNIQKAVKQCTKVNRHITNIMHAYILSVVKDILSTDPEFVAMEDLRVKGMLRNHKIAKSLAGQRLGMFRMIMENEAAKQCVEFGIVNRWYPSSKTCYECGHIKQDLKLEDRVYTCPICGYTADRDYNASLNIRDEYKHIRTIAA